MENQKAKVTSSMWIRTNQTLRVALREGNRDKAKRCARRLVHYLNEMGLLHELDRQESDVVGRDCRDGVADTAEG